MNIITQDDQTCIFGRRWHLEAPDRAIIQESIMRWLLNLLIMLVMRLLLANPLVNVLGEVELVGRSAMRDGLAVLTPLLKPVRRGEVIEILRFKHRVIIRLVFLCFPILLRLHGVGAVHQVLVAPFGSDSACTHVRDASEVDFTVVLRSRVASVATLILLVVKRQDLAMLGCHSLGSHEFLVNMRLGLCGE